MGRGGGAGSNHSGGKSRGFSSHRSSGSSSGRKRSSTAHNSSSFSLSRRSVPKPRRSAWGSRPPRRSAWNSPPPPPPPRRSAWGSPPPPPPRRSYGSGGAGCCGSFIIVLLILAGMFIVGIFFAFLEKTGNLTGHSGQEYVSNDDRKPESADVQEEDKPREKLSEKACVRIEQMIDDHLDWISDTETVRQAMEEFYEMTGVQPYLYICDNLDNKGEEITDEEAESYLKAMYETLYDDEGHMIFVFMEYATSEYITFLYTGEAASDVLDDEAREIFLSNADRYYTDSSLSDEEYFAKIFRESAKQIM